MTFREGNTQGSGTRRSFLTKAGAVGALTSTGLLAGCLGDEEGGEDDEYTFGAGPSDSMSFAMANQFAHNIESNSDHSVDLTSQPSSQALSLVLGGENEMAWATGFIGQQAATQEGPFADVEMNYTPMQIMSYYYMRIGLVAPVDSDIEYYSDLAGEDFAPGPAGASFYPPFEMALQETLSDDEITPRHMDVSELADGLAEERAVAAGGPLKMNGIIPAFMEQAYSQNDCRLLAWEDAAIDAIQNNPMLSGVYESNDEMGDIQEFTTSDETFVVSADFVVYGSEQVSEDTVYEMLETLWNNRDGLEEGHAAFAPFQDDEFWVENLTTELPVHPGAASFYEDQGIWSDDFDVGEV
ncbi:TAXI family TRAP transporter solute-binding subunit [Natrarchaeobius oligotrophus]|uniref:TAXI family TRAP transporter solute-binding subunit n=1 Tax=Natrarchaeobius chitinivorans TaxID=1679083 RepID=A0A3N6MLM0_NATCH|nr:TAXI family TRAP transporter solute-binding subunit [Natrarchaeobius chitinivorans]RQH02375.1 TAXI family TRAP transporter solute-binding subunit [Natrarchaeobius chitinivorans]